MFPARYYPGRYFTGRYWPKVGSSASVVPDVDQFWQVRGLAGLRVGQRNVDSLRITQRNVDNLHTALRGDM